MTSSTFELNKISHQKSLPKLMIEVLLLVEKLFTYKKKHSIVKTLHYSVCSEFNKQFKYFMITIFSYITQHLILM